MTDRPPRKGTVLIVDDDGPVQESIQDLLGTAGYDTRCHPCGEHLLRDGPPEGPACLLLDLNMPGMDGIEVQESLHEAGWDVPIVFLTGHGDVPAAVKALKGGAVDFLQKNGLEPSRLLERIDACLGEHRRRMTERLQVRTEDEKVSSLTNREFEVAHRASAGITNRVIGMELGISERTVEIHRGRAMKKLALRTAAELARMKPAFDRRISE